MRPGYKQTEIGIIPLDWDIEYIENIADISTGSKNTQDRVKDGIYPFFVRSQTVEKINTYSFDGEAVLTAGDGVGTGKIFHHINGKFDVHQRVYLITNFKNYVNPYYFYLYFSTNFYTRIMQMTAKSSVDSVRRDMIARMVIPLPKGENEQKLISQTIQDVDALIENLDKLISKKRDIKQAAMQELLIGKKRLPGFYGEWKEMLLGELGIFLKGAGIKKEEALSGNIPCIRYGEIYTHHTDVIKGCFSWISRDVAERSVRLRKGDLLFAGSGETKEDIGKCVAFVNDDEAYAGGDIVILRADGIDPVYMGYYCNSKHVTIQKASKGQGDAIVHISKAALYGISISIPSLPEQTAIAEVLSDMDVEIETLEKKRSKTRLLKQGMMQELLTGKTRLV